MHYGNISITLAHPFVLFIIFFYISLSTGMELNSSSENSSVNTRWFSFFLFLQISISMLLKFQTKNQSMIDL